MRATESEISSTILRATAVSTALPMRASPNIEVTASFDLAQIFAARDSSSLTGICAISRSALAASASEASTSASLWASITASS